jgi:HAD superfamily phosphatase (TIGR01668 family)
MVEHLEEVAPSLLAQMGIRGVLLDLDNTLAPCRGRDVTLEVTEWVTQLHAVGLRGCVVSNATTEARVRAVAEPLGLAWIYRAHKPLPHGFRRAMKLLGTTPYETAVVGDMIFTDILGGNQLGLYTILVEPVSHHDFGMLSAIQRGLERFTGRKVRTRHMRPPAASCEIPPDESAQR